MAPPARSPTSTAPSLGNPFPPIWFFSSRVLFHARFVTGASGWVGSAVVPVLLSAGHEVTGLARSESAARAIASLGARAHRGSLDDVDALREGASVSDGVIHLAYRHDLAFSGNPHGAATSDLTAIREIGAVLEGSSKPFVVASGLAGLPAGRTATERDAASPDGPGGVRVFSADTALGLATRGVRAAVVHLAPSVHGQGDSGFLPGLVRIARDEKVSAYIGGGCNRWPAVHRDDAARLFRLALEGAPAGSVLHGVDD